VSICVISYNPKNVIWLNLYWKCH